MRRQGDRGFTLIEITIILLVLVILGAILLPMAERFIDLARLVRVREDIGALAAVIELFKVDTCDSFFRVDGRDPSNGDDNRIDLLVGNGDIPMTRDPYWGAKLRHHGESEHGIIVDTIANHLALGDPFGDRPGAPYRRPDEPQEMHRGGFGRRVDQNPFRCGWRGAYIQTPITEDPWGNRYMINVAFLGSCRWRCLDDLNPSSFKQQDVFVLSAGPDETVNTPFVVDGVVAQGDDQIAVVSGSSS